MGVFKLQNILIVTCCLLLAGHSRAQHIARWEACASLCDEGHMDYSSEELDEYDEEWEGQDTEPIQQLKWVPPPLSPHVLTPRIMPKLKDNMKGRGLDDEERCAQYGNISSVCYSHGCQYHLDGGEGCVEGEWSCEAKQYKKCICSHAFCNETEFEIKRTCTDYPAIFKDKLTCRRNQTYYVYHPKQHCLSEEDSGVCDGTLIHAVNTFGTALTDQRGIRYMADKDSKYRDPHNAREPTPQSTCSGIEGVSHVETVRLFTQALYGNWQVKEKPGKCVGYPVPICQKGEYMLTVKISDYLYDVANQRCTEVKINNVPIMVHLDAFALAGGKKCGAGEVVVMFVADGGDDNDVLANLTLHLKGHDESIQVSGGEMELQFCFGYDCIDNNFVVTGFSLERMGSGTVNCTLSDKAILPNNSTKT